MVVAARPNVLGAVLDHLRASPELTALTGTRITSRLQPTWAGMPTYALLVRPAGGPPPPDPGIGRLVTRIDVHCYGETEAKTNDLWSIVDPVLCPEQGRQAAFTRTVDGVPCRVSEVVCEAMPTSGIEPRTNWPRTVSTYLVFWWGLPA